MHSHNFHRVNEEFENFWDKYISAIFREFTNVGYHRLTTASDI